MRVPPREFKAYPSRYRSYERGVQKAPPKGPESDGLMWPFGRYHKTYKRYPFEYEPPGDWVGVLVVLIVVLGGWFLYRFL